MPVAYNPTPIDFSALANLGQIPERLRMRGLRNQFASGKFIKDGVLDYPALVQALGAADPMAGGRAAMSYANAEADQGYRDALLGLRVAEANKPPEPTVAQRDAEFFANIKAENPNDPRLQYAPRNNQRPLSRPVVNDLAEKGEAAFKTREFETSFQDEYGGWGNRVIGEGANYAARNFGVGNEAGAEWWQNYNRQKNITRNKLFGSALTAKESGEWEKADINPGMTPKAIRANLAIQRAATERAARKLANTYVRQGASPEMIEDALGYSLDELGVELPGRQNAAAPPVAPGPRRVPTMSVSPAGEMTPTTLPSVAASAAGDVSEGPQPLPRAKSELQAGRVYNFPDGRQGLWNGREFEVLN